MIATPLRFSPSSVKRSDDGCPRYRARKARPGQTRVNSAPSKRTSRETYGLGPLEKVLDLVEFDDLDVHTALRRWSGGRGRDAHPALVRWTEHAARQYLGASAELADGLFLRPVSRRWARRLDQPLDGLVAPHEEIVYGRRYAGDGVRELRLLRFRGVNDRRRDDAEVALAAAVLSAGGPVLSDPWRPGPLVIKQYEPPRRVRIVEVGCLDGSSNVLFDGAPEEAMTAYERHARTRVHEVAVGEALRPGTDCVRCPMVADCPAVPSVPGLLGIRDDTRPRRTWSVSTARRYGKCPPIPYFHDLNLPLDTGREENESTARGRVVHYEIETRHRRVPPRACAADDAMPGSSGSAKKVGEDGLEMRLRQQMVGDHSLVCPMRNAGGDADAEFLPEHQVVVHDPAADVVVIAKIDLLYRIGGVWRFRETKTCRRLYEGDLLKKYRQVALAVLLSAEGALPGGPGGCRVELERLTATGPVLTEFDVNDPELVREAREIAQSSLAGWHSDDTLATSPGRACQTCGFARWCPDAATGAGT
ncbi:PD-(D/E)XK nuclease family protein [Actinomadura sp. NEAU-AAG7]|uniref:PD-(D/E)XK nuclease family protein n=1 Tax=Actinomadura sp. NEAU-AAG7 TaxID=2839640 RepID=UPI001BE48C0D|nr:PD-(D/E)XK nuclease family protein [Actinomadura sp. NEAU-AAG7]MBT2208728.1 PD-(D/E)XK nuclease family protein [Actinomadura sp. NEAU-AAG7]